MQLIQMRCPNCDANLEVENGIDSFFCKYCGTKIMVSGQDAASIHTKAAVQVANRILDQREARQAARAEERRKQAEHDRKMQPYTLIVGLLIMILLFVASRFMFNDSSSKSTATPTTTVSSTVKSTSTTAPTETEYALQGAIDTMNDIQNEVQGVADAYNGLMDTFNQFKR